MRARAALFRHLRAFFETQTIGMFRVNDCRIHVAEPAEKNTERRRRYAFGREKEIVEVDFGDYNMKVESPLECPPLGRVVLRWPGGEVVGVIDQTTFDRAGEAVRSRQSNSQTERKMAS
jgi:hypothetical protein